MILQFYRTNQPVVNLGLPLIALILWMIWFLEPSISLPFSPDPRGLIPIPEFKWFWISPGIMLVFVVFQAYQFNRLLADAELFDKNYYLPGLIYVIVSWIFIPGGKLAASAFANLFLIMAIKELLSVYRRHDCKKESFNTGFWLGCALLFAWQLLPLVLIMLVSFTILKSINWRESFLLLIGSFIPFFFFNVIYFASNDEIIIPGKIDQYFHFSYLDFGKGNDYFVYALWMLTVFIFISILSYIGRFAGVIMKVRKQRQVLLFLSVSMMMLFVAMNGLFEGQGEGVLIIPLSLLISFLLIHTRLRWISDLYFYVIVALIIIDRIG